MLYARGYLPQCGTHAVSSDPAILTLSGAGGGSLCSLFGVIPTKTSGALSQLACSLSSCCRTPFQVSRTIAARTACCFPNLMFSDRLRSISRRSFIILTHRLRISVLDLAAPPCCITTSHRNFHIRYADSDIKILNRREVSGRGDLLAVWNFIVAAPRIVPKETSGQLLNFLSHSSFARLQISALPGRVQSIKMCSMDSYVLQCVHTALSSHSGMFSQYLPTL